MELSLELLLEKLELQENEYRIRNRGRRYGRIFLYCREEVREGTLFVTDKIPESILSASQCGFLFTDPNQEIPEDFPCEYAQLKKYRDILSIYTRAAAVFFRLEEQVGNLYRLSSEGASILQLLEQSYDLFGNPLYLVDASFKIVAIDRTRNMRELSATWKRLEDDGYMPLDLVENLIRSRELARIEKQETADIIHSNYFYTPFINCNLRYKGAIQGHLFVVGMFRSITRGDLEIAETVSRIIFHALMRNEAFQNERGRLYQHFMRDLLKGRHFEQRYFKRQIRYLNLPKGCRFLIGKFQMEDREEIRYERLSSQLERICEVRLVREDKFLVGLFLLKKEENGETIAFKIEQTLKSFQCTGGFSDVFRQLRNLPVYMQQASLALDRAAVSEAGTSCFFYKKQAVFDLLDMSETKRQIFCAEEIKEIRDYDRQHDTAYGKTLQAYLTHERNVVETAADLHIHRNTCTYRLNKINELFDLELEVPEIRYRYLCSLFLTEIYGELIFH